MCDSNDQEELKKYTRRDFGVWAASAGMLAALPGVANAVAVTEREVTITTPDGTCDAYFVAPASGAAPGVPSPASAPCTLAINCGKSLTATLLLLTCAATISAVSVISVSSFP